ncbi:hypothetical protein C2845_PM08G30500 [Panicum miliaceum]|uniref:Uncharacterized protein n=1 Tax=Panicum miliaceum TaxID=4540 RepID=A0A3L6R1Z3_PANMI|nr:hypothetical protein C2845_PM08G30500 [Panicum miliaceum]
MQASDSEQGSVQSPGAWRQKPPSSCRLASDKAREIVALVHCLVLVVEKEETRPRSIDLHLLSPNQVLIDAFMRSLATGYRLVSVRVAGPGERSCQIHDLRRRHAVEGKTRDGAGGSTVASWHLATASFARGAALGIDASESLRTRCSLLFLKDFLAAVRAARS